MATDADGRTIALNDAMVVAGRVRRIEANELVVILGDGENGMLRVKASDSRLVSAGGGGGGGGGGAWVLDEGSAATTYGLGTVVLDGGSSTT